MTKPVTAKASSFNVAFELADTTWRMLVPVLIFAAVGLFTDKKMHCAPLLTLLGTAIGFVFAALLVKQQIMRGKK